MLAMLEMNVQTPLQNTKAATEQPPSWNNHRRPWWQLFL